MRKQHKDRPDLIHTIDNIDDFLRMEIRPKQVKKLKTDKTRKESEKKLISFLRLLNPDMGAS